MHSRNFAKSLCFPLRTGIVIFSMVAGAAAGETAPFQPMSGACFLHDSGLEYIPTRLLGIEDVPASVDRDDLDSWTCTDPVPPTALALPDDAPIDCAGSFDAQEPWSCERQAEQFERRRIAVDGWNQISSKFASLASASRNVAADWLSRSMQHWNGLVAKLGQDIASRIPIKTQPELDCPWDREPMQNADTIQAKPNLFVFTLSPSAVTVSNVNAEPPVIEPKTPWLERTAFARDYCVFAPYPLDDTVAPGELCGPVEIQIDQSPVDPYRAEESLQSQQRAVAAIQRSVSRTLARKMAWLGSTLLQWSETLESSVRLAEASDAGPHEGLK